MCGIAAIVAKRSSSLESIGVMVEALTHRGPDDAGVKAFPEDGAALGMCRLSIIDLAGGHQPMSDEAGRTWVVFNGEIYNFVRLRRELERLGHRFRTDHSDTEVIVHGYEEWGDGIFSRLDGMFAIVIWDRDARILVVARDRCGEKPLYVARLPHGYAVASELKALLRHPELPRDIDLIGLEQYVAFDFTVAPRTILSSVKKLQAGHIARIGHDTYEESRYWLPEFNVVHKDEAVLRRGLDAALDEAVRSRLIADVPVGLFLSGGLDSTTVGWYMRRYSDDVHSFSVGFEEASHDESSFAQLAANSIGTKHHLEVFSQRRIQELVPRIADVLDEPMADSSIFPTYFLSSFTRRQVKVALGGDGSDELLMGYRAYKALKLSWAFEPLPERARAAIAFAARRIPSHLGRIPVRGVQFAGRLDGTVTHRLLTQLASFRGDGRYVLAPGVRTVLPRSVFAEPTALIREGLPSSLSAADQTIASYLRSYLQEDILVKVDRASMAASLEVRSPFLAPALIDFALTIPPSLKLRRMTGKYLLRELMRGRIPDAIIDRQKRGFAVPLSSWFRSALEPTVREYLDPTRLRSAGYFDPDVVSRLVDQHLSGRKDRGRELWVLLQFELWRERWLQ